MGGEEQGIKLFFSVLNNWQFCNNIQHILNCKSMWIQNYASNSVGPPMQIKRLFLPKLVGISIWGLVNNWGFFEQMGRMTGEPSDAPDSLMWHKLPHPPSPFWDHDRLAGGHLERAGMFWISLVLAFWWNPFCLLCMVRLKKNKQVWVSSRKKSKSHVACYHKIRDSSTSGKVEFYCCTT